MRNQKDVLRHGPSQRRSPSLPHRPSPDQQRLIPRTRKDKDRKDKQDKRKREKSPKTKDLEVPVVRCGKAQKGTNTAHHAPLGKKKTSEALSHRPSGLGLGAFYYHLPLPVLSFLPLPPFWLSLGVGEEGGRGRKKNLLVGWGSNKIKLCVVG